MSYRHLTSAEIDQLKAQGCLADDWQKVWVAPAFTTTYVHDTRFSGEVKLGVFENEFELPGGIRKHARLRWATLHNVTIGNNCLVENIQNYIANYTIGDNCFIENVDLMLVDGVSTFGNGIEVAVLNETGGREVAINQRPLVLWPSTVVLPEVAGGMLGLGLLQESETLRHRDPIPEEKVLSSTTLGLW